MSTKYKIIDKVIDCINAGASGRLIIFKPEKPASGEDLVVEKRGDYVKKNISLKVLDKSEFENFSSTKINNFYLVFVHFDFIKLDIEEEIFVVLTLDSKKIIIKKTELGKFLIEQMDKKIK
jgi:hypothetical protein